MRLPLRRGERQKRDEDSSILLTKAGRQRLETELTRLERERPQAIEDVERLAQLGDFSENAEYQEAKQRLRRILARIFSLKDRLARTVLIQKDQSNAGLVSLGSSVTVQHDGQEKTFLIVGPSESNPSRGRISHLSPLGSTLIGHKVGETVVVRGTEKETAYRIIAVQ